jgi:hypothetical protein
LEQKSNKKTYRILLIKNLFFDSVYTVFLLLFYWFAWRLADTITYIGQLRTNIPLLAGCGLMLLVLLTRVYWIYRKQIKQRFLYESDQAMNISTGQLSIAGEEFSLTELKYIRSYRNWWLLHFNKNRIIPISKKMDLSFQRKRSVPSLWMLSLALFIVITVMGGYKVYYNAIDYHGALSWGLERLATEDKVDLGSDNIYDIGLQGIIDAVDKEVGMEPYLMTDNLEITFDKDGTITSFYAYVNGYDEEKVHRHNYLITSDSGGDSVVVDEQEWEDDQYPYIPENDLQHVLDMMKYIPVGEVVQEMGQDQNALMYKGIREWAFPENLQYVTEKGEIFPVSTSVKGPTVSLYVPGKEDVITPYRYIPYKQ